MTSYEDQMEQQADGEMTAEQKAAQQPRFRVAVEMVSRAAWDLSRRAERFTGEWTYVRYADAAAHFWGFVQLQPDDGWDTFGGAPHPADANPYDLDRRGRDYTRGDQPWHVSLTVVNS